MRSTLAEGFGIPHSHSSLSIHLGSTNLGPCPRRSNPGAHRHSGPLLPAKSDSCPPESLQDSQTSHLPSLSGIRSGPATLPLPRDPKTSASPDRFFRRRQNPPPPRPPDKCRPK